jgi:hypothetical protein
MRGEICALLAMPRFRGGEIRSTRPSNTNRCDGSPLSSSSLVTNFADCSDPLLPTGTVAIWSTKRLAFLQRVARHIWTRALERPSVASRISAGSYHLLRNFNSAAYSWAFSARLVLSTVSTADCAAEGDASGQRQDAQEKTNARCLGGDSPTASNYVHLAPPSCG